MDKFDCTLRCAIDSAIHFKFTVFCNCLDSQQSERRVLVAKETSSASVEKQGMKRCFLKQVGGEGQITIVKRFLC